MSPVQGSHADAALESMSVLPAGQAEHHANCSDTSVPAGHAAHGAPIPFSLANPAGHSAQTVEFAAEYWPSGHSWQAVAGSSSVSARPASHGWHNCAPTGPTAPMLANDGSVVPGGQALHSVVGSISRSARPGTQLSHSVSPGASVNWPSAQVLHGTELSRLTRPTTHSAHAFASPAEYEPGWH